LNPESNFNFRRSIRLPGYDYRQAGIYFVTLCTHQKAGLFGRIYDGEMHSSKLGIVVDEEWRRMAMLRKNVQLDLHVVMPNHVHGLIVMEDNSDCHSSRGFPTKTGQASHTLQADSLGAIIGQFKVAVTRRARSIPLHSDQRIWQRNYHEHVVRDEKSLNSIRRYVIENPARWAEDSYYVD
jgi:REP element-mobilizing transposase RayT